MPVLSPIFSTKRLDAKRMAATRRVTAEVKDLSLPSIRIMKLCCPELKPKNVRNVQIILFWLFLKEFDKNRSIFDPVI